MAGRPARGGLLLAMVLLVVGVGGCATAPPAARPAPPEFVGNTAAGYLPATALPDSLALLAPPPAAGSLDQQADADANAATRKLQGGPRWALAAADNPLDFPEVAGVFSCALGVPIDRGATPRLFGLLQRSLADAGRATGAAKDHYKRARPFLVNGAPICARDTDRPRLEHSGSYPSGHASAGWAWALILAEVAPERSGAILARGRAYGESRLVCNVHWRSDIAAGEVIGAATVAALHADATFRADVEAARNEVATLRARGERPRRDCAAEAAALAQRVDTR